MKPEYIAYPTIVRFHMDKPETPQELLDRICKLIMETPVPFTVRYTADRHWPTPYSTVSGSKPTPSHSAVILPFNREKKS